MNEDELKQIKEMIINRIAEMETSVQYLEKETRPIAPSVSLGRLTRMEALNDKGINEHILLQNRQTLEKLKNALGRIQAGNYGVCLRCGQEISSGRLKLMPEAVICVPCAERKR